MAATLNYMSLDRSDVQHSAEIHTKMVNPTRSWKMLKKACRFLKVFQKVRRVMGPWTRGEETHIDVHVDSDRAKRPERKSSNGDLMTINGTVVQHCSMTQASRALSTAEAEYYLRSHHGDRRRSRYATDDDGLEPGCACSRMDGLQRSKSNCFKEGARKDQTH